MKILQVASEVAPYVKVGGLADVVGALGKALVGLGHEVRTLCPLYGGIQRDASWRAHDRPLLVPVGDADHACRVWEYRPGATEPAGFFLEHLHYFERHEVYDGPWGPHADNDRRFIFLSRAAIDLVPWMDWVPDIVHVHDWSTALTSVYLNHLPPGHPLAAAASVLTIHNLQHQGYCHRDLLAFSRLPHELFRPDSLESMGALNLLKGGIYHSTKITTVSPTYAREIQESPGGSGLDPVLRFRAGDLLGILNGIDTTVWNPAADPALPRPFSAADLSGKAAAKTELQRLFQLEVDPTRPIFGVVARLYDQKGLDLLQVIVPRLMASMRIQLVILGTGDPGLEAAFRWHAQSHRGQVGAMNRFDERLAHLVYAGSDFFVMPSRFEPCGLGQMYAMRYGTPPVARATGGLRDTIAQYQEGRGEGTGFLFEAAEPDALYYTMGWACSTWYDRPAEYRLLQLQGMLRDFSWDASARRYLDLYGWALQARRG